MAKHEFLSEEWIAIQGDMTKMMAMQTVQPDPAQVEMAAEIAEITA